MTLVKRGTQIRELPEGFLRLLSKLRAFRVNGWESDSDGPTWPKIDREAAGLIDADVVSSAIRAEDTTAHPSRSLHVLAIDIDVPAYLVESSTAGHHHLYVDVPGGIPHDVYMRLLKALADAKVIQQGYANMAEQRGHSDLRLPWVAKQNPYAVPEGPETKHEHDFNARVDASLAAMIPLPAPLPPPPAQVPATEPF